MQPIDERLAQLARHKAIPKALQSALRTIALKLEWPMGTILAMVPGDSVAARARTLGVSRNTFYKWLNEQLRPSQEQAAVIAKVTGVSIARIRANDGEEDEAGRSPGKTAARMAKAGERVPRRSTRSRAERRRVAAEP